MKKVLSILLVAVMLLSMFACSKPAPKSDGDLVTIYVRTKKNQYSRDLFGKPILAYQTTYSYDNAGNLLSEKLDAGDYIEIWNEDSMIYEYANCHINGTIDTSWEYQYDDHGTLVNYIWHDTYSGFERKEDYTNHGITYTYNAAGQPESMTIHEILLGGEASDETWSIFYRYDDNGNLIRVERENQNSDELILVNKFSYDEQNRLTQAFHYSLEHAQLFEYSYDDAGRLKTLNYSTTSYLQGINELDDTYRLLKSTQFAYDDQGNLISKKEFSESGDLKKSTICEYDSGKLTSVCTYVHEFLERSYTFTYNAENAEGGYEVSFDNITLVYDEHGNLTKKMSSEGFGYTCEYTAMRVTKEQAEQFYRAEHLRNQKESGGFSDEPLEFSILAYHLVQVPYPTTIFNAGFLNHVMNYY